MTGARTVSVSINRPSAEVYEYLADPAYFPEWSAFITRIRRDGADWLAATLAGEARISFAPRNAFGILDHHVTVSPQQTVYVPMRVVKNGEGAEVIFTVFRLPGMSDRQYEEDAAMVLADLANLKRVMERE